jgi:Tfp pilus assembly protein PilO
MRLIISIIMLGASLVGFLAYILPTYRDIAALRAEQADYNTVLDNAKKLQQERNKLVEKYNALDPALLAQLNTLLPNNPGNVKLILELDALARQYGMVLQNVKIDDADAVQAGTARPGTPAINSEVGNLKITFSLLGPYPGFTNFVRSVEKSLRVIDIQKVSFNAVDDKQNYQYTIGVKTYWVK